FEFAFIATEKYYTFCGRLMSPPRSAGLIEAFIPAGVYVFFFHRLTSETYFLKKYTLKSSSIHPQNTYAPASIIYTEILFRYWYFYHLNVDFLVFFQFSPVL